MAKSLKDRVNPYGYKWSQARKRYLAANPLCVECSKVGLTRASEVVDHIIPHKRDHKLFWDRSNWQALCTHCHNSHKKRLEMSGNKIGCDINGLPLDEKHFWRKG